MRPRPPRCATHFAGLNLLLLVATLLGLGFLFGCAPKEKGAIDDTEKKPESESRVQHGTNGEATITVDAVTQKAIGLAATPIEQAQLPTEAKAYGHVVDSAPLATLVADLTAAQAGAVASSAEMKRLEGLAASNNASEKALEAARASAVRDDAQVQSVRLRLLANWGKSIAQRGDLAGFVQSLSSLELALVQLNLPAGEALPALPAGARLTTLAEQSRPIEAKLLGPAPVTDPQMQNRGFLFLVESNVARLGPGEAVSGLLALPGEPVTGVSVPRAAMLQHNGATWVYLQKSEDKFQRVEIHPDAPLDDAILVREGLHAGDKVVTVGAQQLLSEELKGQGGE